MKYIKLYFVIIVFFFNTVNMYSRPNILKNVNVIKSNEGLIFHLQLNKSFTILSINIEGFDRNTNEVVSLFSIKTDSKYSDKKEYKIIMPNNDTKIVNFKTNILYKFIFSTDKGNFVGYFILMNMHKPSDDTTVDFKNDNIKNIRIFNCDYWEN